MGNFTQELMENAANKNAAIVKNRADEEMKMEDVFHKNEIMKNNFIINVKAWMLVLFFGLMVKSGWGQVTLPVSRTAWASPPTGWTDVMGTYYSTSFACSGNDGGKFDASSSSTKVNFSGIPYQLSFVVKSNNTSSTSSLAVEESSDNSSWTAVTTALTGTTGLPTTCTTKGPYTLLTTSRYVKLSFTKGSSNMTIDDVSITSATPAAPTITSITPGNGQLSVAFTAGAIGASAITNYKYSTDGGATFTAVSPTSTSSPIVIAGLTNGTSYDVQIKAINTNGDGAATASTAATPRTTPSAPTIGTITPGNGQLSVAFTAGSDGGASITDYKWSVDGTTYTTRAGTASPIVINGLTNGTAYTVRIRAVNAAGDGSVATAASAATPRTTPSAPTIGTITPGNGQLSVAFTAGSDGGSSITDYKWSVDGTTYTTRAGTTSPIVITGLTNGTAYTVRIRAVNAAGDGSVATASAAATPVTSPSAPTITSITPGDQELSVAFTSGATGGSAITNYKYSTDGGSSFIAVSPATTTSPITITGLTNGTTYDVQIKAVNAQGDGSATATTQGTPSAAAVAPGAPTITSITPGNGQLSVAFTAGATGGSAITNYKYSTDGGATFTAVTPSATTSPITITGLINGTSYNVQIMAVNAVGDGTATASTAATPSTTPSAPTITGITAGNTQLSVAFIAGASGGSSITNYKYSTDGGSTFTAVSPAANTSPITITGLSNGTTYNVQIKAVNAIGDGTATASTAGTPATTPGVPTIGTATAGNGEATITFTAPGSNGGSAITSYTATSNPGAFTGTLYQAGSGTITVTGLTNGTAYAFTIKANNAAGPSNASGVSNSVTPTLSAPTAAAATSILANGFTANWNAVTGASSGYLLDVSKSATFEATALATDLFISEYVEGSSNNKYIEIYNGTGATVDLSLYELGIAANGVGTPSYSTMTGSLANGATIVYKNSSATLTLPAGVTAINSGACGFNGDDAIVLHKVAEAAATFVDVFGRVGNDPGTSWSSTSNSTVDKTLARKSSIISGITSSPTGTGAGAFTTLETEWNQSNVDVVSGLGSHSISVIEPSFVSGYNAKPISGQSTVSSTITGLSENTTYYYRIRATDGSASANSNVITVTTKQTPTVTPTVGTYTYTGSALGPNAATNTGTGSTYTFSYSGTGATTYGPSSTRPTDVGTYTVTASVAADGNYVAASSSATAFSISYPTNNWTGATSNNWNTAGNWSLSRVPLSTDNITISIGSPIMDVNHTLGNGNTFTISGSGTLTINPGITLTIAGTADFGGKSVTLKSTAAGTGAIGQITGTLTGASNVTVERYISSITFPGSNIADSRKYRYLAAPFETGPTIATSWQQQIFISGPGTGGTVCSGIAGNAPTMNSNGYHATANNNPSMYLFDEATATPGSNNYSSTWTCIGNPTTTNLTAGVGYNVFIRGAKTQGCAILVAPYTTASEVTLSANGTIKTGTFNFTIGYHPSTGNGWNLIGNPYPCEIDWDATGSAWSKNLLDNAVYLYNPIGDNYAVYSNSASQVSLNGGQQYIPSGTSFFVKANSLSSSLSVTEAAKTSTNATPLLKGNKPFSIQLKLAYSNGRKDESLVLLNQNLTDGFDKIYDVEKLANPSNVNIYSIDATQKQYAVNAIANIEDETEKILPLGIGDAYNGNYVLHLEAPNLPNFYQIFLRDHYLNQEQQLFVGDSINYNFTVTNDTLTAGNSRFDLYIGNKRPHSTGLSKLPSLADVKVYPNPSKDLITVSMPVSAQYVNSLVVYNVMGQMVKTIEHPKMEEQINLCDLGAGMYFLSFVGNGQVLKTVKVCKN